jgi:hypothetical protein
MRHITLCMAYYLNAGMLRAQYTRLQSLPDSLRRYVSFSLVDDGSPSDPAWLEPVGYRAVLHRITVDVRWNQDAARNLAVNFAPGPWVLLTDMDHLVPRVTWERLILGDLDARTVYRLGRVNYPGGDPYKPHPNTWLMTRHMFDTIGGYDERFAGYYGTDADFAERVKRYACVEFLPEVVERVPREIIADASTTTYERKTPQDRENIAAIKRRRSLEPPPVRPLRHLFPFERVSEWPQRS